MSQLKKIVKIGALAVLAGSFFLMVFLLYLVKTLPSIDQLSNIRVVESTKIYDREGKTLLYEISNGQKRTVVPFDQIPKTLKDATIAIEDEKFYEGGAFDWQGIIRALLVNIRYGEIRQGGSTITQQLARNAFLTPEQTITRKAKELMLAIQLSRHYSKDQILALYLNQIPYGINIYGVEAASKTYFGKPARDLTLVESALLAAIPKASTKYSPWGKYRNDLIDRQQVILNKMQKLGKISEDELAKALRTPLVFLPQQTQSLQAPHFVMEVQEYLAQKYGDELVRVGGLQVVTTLNVRLQEIAQKAVSAGAAENERLYKGKNAALVAEDPKTGQVLALVGSRNYFDVKNDGNFNVATQGLRQPGSALKPFVYLAAFEKGFSPETVLFDVPTEFTSKNSKCPAYVNFKNRDKECFHPENFDHVFRGPVNIRDSLSQSINVPAVKTLYLVGLEDAVKRMTNFGIKTLNNPERYGLSLVLGGGEVKLADLVNAYATIADDGKKHEQVFVLEVRDKQGRVLESFKDRVEQVTNPLYPRLITEILSDVEARRKLFQTSLPLTIFPDRDVALKTGTSNDYRDAWAIGYTPSFVGGVWAGNNDNTAMQRQGSSLLAAIPIWSSFMKQALELQVNEAFPRPESHPAPSKPILRGDYTANNHVHTILYYVKRDTPTGDPPTNPTDDPQFTNWEASVLAWARANLPNFASMNQTPLTPQAPGENSAPPVITLRSPSAGSFVQNQISVNGNIIATSPIKKITVYVNEQIVREEVGHFGTGYALSWVVSPYNLQSQNSFRLEVVDEKNMRSEVSSIIYK